MLLGLIGSKGAGKDETANYIREKYGFVQYAFATPLKNICKELFSLTDEQLHGNLKETFDERWNTTPRTILQKIGTDLFRQHLKDVIPELSCDNIWIRHFELWFEAHQEERCVISDGRFSDEIKTIQQRGGIIIHINRNVVHTDTHVSEQIHKQFIPNYTIDNNGTIEELHEQIDKLFEKLSYLQ